MKIPSHKYYLRLNNKVFRRKFGVKPKTFLYAYEVIKSEYNQIKKCGCKNKLTLGNMLLLWLCYIREYNTYSSIGIKFGVSESTAYRICRKVEKLLIKSGKFNLSNNSVLLNLKSEDIICIDVSESPIQRPSRSRTKKNRKNRQKRYYSGKKKKHSIKSQIIIDKNTRSILSVKFSNGKRHDFRMYKESKVRINPNAKKLVDSGYTGISKYQSNCLIPKKRSKKNPLTKQDKKFNSEISSQRVCVEHVFAALKKFKIISDKYRNRRKRFGLRFTLIAAFYNLELTF